MFHPFFWLESSTDILCLAYQGLRCHVLTRFIQRQLLMRISNLIPHSLNLQCKLHGIRSLRNKIFWSFVFGVMALTIFKQTLLSFNAFNILKLPLMTNPKHLHKVKQNWKRLFSAFFFVTFSKGGTVRQKANAHAWNHADHSNLNTEWRTHLSKHGLNGISLHSVGFELFKKVLLVALGIWLSIWHKLLEALSTTLLPLLKYDHLVYNYMYREVNLASQSTSSAEKMKE